MPVRHSRRLVSTCSRLLPMLVMKPSPVTTTRRPLELLPGIADSIARGASINGRATRLEASPKRAVSRPSSVTDASTTHPYHAAASGGGLVFLDVFLRQQLGHVTDRFHVPQ